MAPVPLAQPLRVPFCSAGMGGRAQAHCTPLPIVSLPRRRTRELFVSGSCADGEDSVSRGPWADERRSHHGRGSSRVPLLRDGLTESIERLQPRGLLLDGTRRLDDWIPLGVSYPPSRQIHGPTPTGGWVSSGRRDVVMTGGRVLGGCVRLGASLAPPSLHWHSALWGASATVESRSRSCTAMGGRVWPTTRTMGRGQPRHSKGGTPHTRLAARR